ncbi:MAG: mucoidy inhibitor MuiA family protein [Bacteroidetes bacterium]|nr:mucoidy inhibitor MuiA family protein [Bacteroidota bacterium]
MKKIIWILIGLMPLFSAAQEKTTEVESDLDEVTLFLQGAQVTRKASTPVPQGISRLVFTGITNQLDPNSIRVSASKNVVILSVTGNNAVLNNPRKAPIIRMLEDSLKWVEYELEKEWNTHYVLEQQESLLLTNKDLKGDKGLILIDLEDALIIYQKQLAQIKQGELDSKMREQSLNERKYQLQRQLNEFRKSNMQPSYEVVVTVSAAKSSLMETLSLTYFVQNATWIPNYDLRVDDLKKLVKLHYKADIYNNTGENWDNVKLTLSSGNPNLGGVPPVLVSQILSFEAPRTKDGYNEGLQYDKKKLSNNVYYEDLGDQAPPAPIANFDQKNTSFQFAIPARMKVVANNQAQNVDLTQFDLNGSFRYFAVPKIEEDAFLTSRVTGWEALNLLIGEANIYFEGTFMGKTLIDPSVTKDTLSVSLGRDKGVLVKREKLKDFCSSNFSGSKKKDVLVYEITVKNNKKEAVDIQIQDQIPVASNKEIDVEVVNNSGATYIDNSGKLIWTKTLAPGETQKIRIEYEVRYPKDKVISGL